MRVWLLGVWVLAGAAAALPAQRALTPTSKIPPTGSVSGHVYYADTNGPARMATVLLEGAAAIDGYQPGAGDGATAHISSVKTLPDGSFSVPHVKPGAYYVFASAPGYVSPLDVLGLTREEIQKPDKETKERIAAAVPRVLVQANLPAATDVTLERGAAVMGTVLYDDGSPAAGLDVKLLVRKRVGKEDKWVTPESDPAQMSPSFRTDDQGHYRISGLPAREYLVEVDLALNRTSIEVGGGGMSMNEDAGYSVPVYSGNKLRQKEAEPFRLKLGEERPGEDVEVPLNKLHGIAGVITAASDGHTINSGQVSLLYADDKTEALSTKMAKNDTGFALSFVPDGNYILRVSNAADMEYTEIANDPGTWPGMRTESHAVHSYGTGEQPVHVSGDVTGLAVAVPEVGAKGSQASGQAGH